MAMITINASDLISTSRADLNTNFATLQSEKEDVSNKSIDTTFASNSDTLYPSQKAVKAYIDGQGNNLAPTGAITAYAAATAPTGWLLADGTAVSRATYSALFTVISTTYGAGNGTTTFNVPNLSGRIPVGVGTGTKIATFASRSSNVITVTGLTDAANNEFQTGQAVLYTAASGAMTGLTHNTTYYVIRTGNLTFSLASSLANAQNATVISLSSDGTGTQTFTATLTARTLGDTGGEENHAMSATELLSHTHTNNANLNGGSGGVGGTTTGQAAANGSTGGNAAMNAMQPFMALNYIIKT